MPQTQRVFLRRRLTALAVLAASAALVGAAFGAGGGRGGNATAGSDTAAQAPARPRPTELPRGGRTIFPRYRVVAFYGAPQSRELGALGIGSPDHAARRLAQQAAPYARPTRPVLPAFELLADIANRDPGP